MYTDQLLNDLIFCSKKIIEPPKDFGINRGSYKYVFNMVSVDGLYSFNGFITKNTTFQENFSIGLVYIPKEEKGKFCLLRCNGLHGEVINIPHHSFCHIHRVNVEDINNGIKVEKHIEETTEYSTFDEAIQFYIRYINILPEDRKKYFPPPSGQIEIEF
jgi:hypothetical protein